MGQNFIGCDREQELLLPPSLREWLPEGHLAWFVIDAVAELDLTAFYGAYRVDGWGRAAHDPAMMVALLLYTYASGERSSRRIERRCQEDVATRVICANQVPDHCTIARFRKRHETALGQLFGEVLALCAEARLVQAGVIAVDGTKVHASASQHATRDYEQIASEMLAEADAVDRAEDEQFGERRGDELPPELATAQGRRGWLREAKRRLDHKRAEEARPIPRSRPQRLQESKRQLEEEHKVECHANADYEAYRARGVMKDGRRFGRPPKPYQPPAVPAGKINVTDPDSQPEGAARLHAGLQRPGRLHRGPDRDRRRDQRRLTRLRPPRTDGHRRPGRARAGRDRRPPEVVLADAGYWHQHQMDDIVSRGIQVLVPPDAGKRKGARPGWDGGRYAFMRHVLATEHGGALYRKRQAMIEPIFAHTKFNRRIDRFQRRGRAAARSEWRLITATHNLLKLWNHTTTPLAA